MHIHMFCQQATAHLSGVMRGHMRENVLRDELRRDSPTVTVQFHREPLFDAKAKVHERDESEVV